MVTDGSTSCLKPFFPDYGFQLNCSGRISIVFKHDNSVFMELRHYRTIKLVNWVIYSILTIKSIHNDYNNDFIFRYDASGRKPT